MAKKKVEVPVVEAPEVETTVAEEQSNETVEQADNQPETENSETQPVEEITAPAEPPKAKKAKTDAQPSLEEIPDNVKGILKAFNNQPELYVSATGRVFSPGAKPSLRGNAILYKNPFYNSKS